MLCNHFLHEAFYPFCDQCPENAPFLSSNQFWACSLCRFQLCTSHFKTLVDNQAAENQRSPKRPKSSKSSKPSASISDIPSELLKVVYSYLSFLDIRFCAMSCQYLKSVEKACISQIRTLDISPTQCLPNSKRDSQNSHSRRNICSVLDATAAMCHKLRTLKLVNIEPGDVEQSIFRILDSCSSLETFHLECSADNVQRIHNPSPKPFRRIFISLYRTFSSIKHLTLFSEEIIWILDDKCIQSLITRSPNLTTLRLKLFFGLGGAFRAVHTPSKSLTTLELIQCGFTNRDCEGIPRTAPHLRTLNLSQCAAISDEGIRQVLHCTSLQNLNLTGLSVTTNTLRMMAQKSVCPDLKELRMNFSSYMDANQKVHKNHNATLELCRHAMATKPGCRLVASPEVAPVPRYRAFLK